MGEEDKSELDDIDVWLKRLESLGREVRPWDVFAAAYIASTSSSSAANAAVYADQMMAERRKRMPDA